jgi:hypothetical protein
VFNKLDVEEHTVCALVCRIAQYLDSLATAADMAIHQTAISPRGGIKIFKRVVPMNRRSLVLPSLL